MATLAVEGAERWVPGAQRNARVDCPLPASENVERRPVLLAWGERPSGPVEAHVVAGIATPAASYSKSTTMP